MGPHEGVLNLAITLAEVGGLFEICDDEGHPMPPNDLPLAVALLEGRPTQGRVKMRGFGKPWMRLDVTAFPVEGQGGRVLGAAVLFWEIEAI